MSEIIKNDAVRSKVETVFKVLLFIYLSLGTCNLTYRTPIISVFVYPTFLLGAVCLLWRLVLFKKFVKSPHLLWPVLLLVFYAFSAVMNLQYLNKQLILVFALWCFYFLILFINDPDKTQDDFQKEIKLFFVIYLIYVTVLVAISIIMMLSGYGLAYRDPNNNNYEVVKGFFYGRLWGAFQDPNLGSVMCNIAIVISVFFIWKLKKKIVTVLLCLDIVAMIFYIAVSDSRNGLVTSGCICGFSAFFCLFRKYGGEKSLLKKSVCLLAAVLCAAVGIVIPKTVKNGYNKTIMLVYSEKGAHGSDETQNYNSVLIERGYDIKDNVSNNRFAIWETGIKVAVDNLATGTTFEGLLPYVKENYPNSYMVSNGLWEFNTLDNDYLNIFASLGLPGIATVVILMVISVICLFKNIFTVAKEYYPVMLVCAVTVCMLAVSALFQGTMFYQQTPNTAMFWMFLGYVVFFTPKRKNADKAVEKKL